MQAMQRDLRRLRVEPGIALVAGAQIGKIAHLVVRREALALQSPRRDTLLERGVIEPLVQAQHFDQRGFLRCRRIEPIDDLA
ncbi:MAG TPA: hypothetical protein VMH02_06310 [Verrucomicrobiae bacterium]|nr:hypothetical protein [Verrucomicrobiae bacterium]